MPAKDHDVVGLHGDKDISCTCCMHASYRAIALAVDYSIQSMQLEHILQYRWNLLIRTLKILIWGMQLYIFDQHDRELLLYNIIYIVELGFSIFFGRFKTCIILLYI